VTVRVVDQPNKVTVTEEVVTVQVASVGVQGPPGGPGVEISPTEPTNTDILWADTTEPGDQVIPPGGGTGDVLAKVSSNDYDSGWVTLDAVPTSRQVNTSGTGLSGGGDLTADRTITLDPSALAADTAFTSAFAATTATLTVASESTNLRHEGLGLPNTFFVGQGGNRNFAASTLQVWPFVVTEPITVTNWVADVRTNTSASTETMRAGVYEIDSELVLGDLVVEFPTLTVPTGTGLYVTALAAPLDLLPGRYAVAWVVSASTFTLRTPQTAIPFVRLAQTNNLPARFVYGANGAYPVANPLPDPVTNQVNIQTDAASWGPSVLLVWSYT
jgi:hypothetical protein